MIYSLLGIGFNVGISWYVESLGFAYGVILSNKLDIIKKIFKKRYYLLCITLSFLAMFFGIVYSKYKNTIFIGNYILRVILDIILIMLILCVTSKFKIENKFTLFLGNISYEVFLIHGFIISILISITIKNNYIKLSSGEFVIIAIIGSILFAYLFNKIDSIIIKLIKSKK